MLVIPVPWRRKQEDSPALGYKARAGFQKNNKKAPNQSNRQDDYRNRQQGRQSRSLVIYLSTYPLPSSSCPSENKLSGFAGFRCCVFSALCRGMTSIYAGVHCPHTCAILVPDCLGVTLRVMAYNLSREKCVADMASGKLCSLKAVCCWDESENWRPRQKEGRASAV